MPYYTPSGVKRFDYGYRRDGSYALIVPVKGMVIRRKAKPEQRTGAVCIACGIQRSVSGRCECNS